MTFWISSWYGDDTVTLTFLFIFVWTAINVSLSVIHVNSYLWQADEVPLGGVRMEARDEEEEEADEHIYEEPEQDR